MSNIHKRRGLTVDIAVCGDKDGERTHRWKDVTCYKCMELKPKKDVFIDMNKLRKWGKEREEE